MTELWVERTGVRRYTGRSSRGAEVLVGNEDVEGVFTPGELMPDQLARLMRQIDTAQRIVVVISAMRTVRVSTA